MIKKLLKKRIVSIAYFAIIICAFCFYISKLDTTKIFQLELNIRYILPALGLMLFARFWLAYIWFYLLKQQITTPLAFKDVLYVYAKSWLARYIPGPATWAVAKLYFSKKTGLSTERLAFSSLVESGIQLSVIIFFGLFLLALNAQITHIYYALLLVPIGIFSLIHPVMAQPIISFIAKNFPKTGVVGHQPFSAKTLSSLIGFFTVSVCCSSLAVFLIAKFCFHSLGNEHIFFLMGANALSAALSMLVVFLPSAFGIKDGILLMFITTITAPEQAIAIVITVRLFMVFIDLLFYSVAKLNAPHPST